MITYKNIYKEALSAENAVQIRLNLMLLAIYPKGTYHNV